MPRRPLAPEHGAAERNGRVRPVFSQDEEAELHSVVIYESFHGNTEASARAVAEGLSRHGKAETFTVAEIESSTLTDVDLLVVGAPTHARGLPRARTRASVRTDLGGTLVRDWLVGVPAGDDGRRLPSLRGSRARGSSPGRRRRASPAGCAGAAGSRPSRRASSSPARRARWPRVSSPRPWRGATSSAPGSCRFVPRRRSHALLPRTKEDTPSRRCSGSTASW